MVTFPSMATVKNLLKEFRTSVLYKPLQVENGEITEDICNLVLHDRCLPLRVIVETVGNAVDCVNYIMHEILDIRKLSTRSVPHLLTPRNKRNRATTSLQYDEQNFTSTLQFLCSKYE